MKSFSVNIVAIHIKTMKKHKTLKKSTSVNGAKTDKKNMFCKLFKFI